MQRGHDRLAFGASGHGVGGLLNGREQQSGGCFRVHRAESLGLLAGANDGGELQNRIMAERPAPSEGRMEHCLANPAMRERVVDVGVSLGGHDLRPIHRPVTLGWKGMRRMELVHDPLTNRLEQVIPAREMEEECALRDAGFADHVVHPDIPTMGAKQPLGGLDNLQFPRLGLKAPAPRLAHQPIPINDCPTEHLYQTRLIYQAPLIKTSGMSLLSAVSPPEFLQLAGHPLRWRLLGELARSDRIVHELTELVGEPQNLVSYHLGRLREGRLVSAKRSSADRRDTYYGLDLERVGGMLSAAGGALHPGLRLSRPSRDPARIGPARVLFLCTGNSARSPMAEALTKARSGGAIETTSAGSHPRPIHPNAVRVMRDEYGIELADHVGRSLDAFSGQRFDWVISLCDRVREVCPEFPEHPQIIHWSIANPATGDADDVTYPLFQQTAAELATRIDFLLAALADRGLSTSQGEEP